MSDDELLGIRNLYIEQDYYGRPSHSSQPTTSRQLSRHSIPPPVDRQPQQLSTHPLFLHQGHPSEIYLYQVRWTIHILLSITALSSLSHLSMAMDMDNRARTRTRRNTPLALQPQ